MKTNYELALHERIADLLTEVGKLTGERDTLVSSNKTLAEALDNITAGCARLQSALADCQSALKRSNERIEALNNRILDIPVFTLDDDTINHAITTFAKNCPGHVTTLDTFNAMSKALHAVLPKTDRFIVVEESPEQPKNDPDLHELADKWNAR